MFSAILATTSASLAAPLSADGILYSVVNPTFTTTIYTSFNRTWIATSASATLSFSFRHDDYYWVLDDVAVYHGMTQLLINGDFENGMTGWTRTGVCDSNDSGVYYSTTHARSGTYYYAGSCVGRTDTSSQTFATVAGDVYRIDFWLKNRACCPQTLIANITIR